MKNSFLLCEDSISYEITHVICVTHPAIFDFPGLNLISGCSDPKVRENAILWLESGCKSDIAKVRSKPSGYQEALEYVRANRNLVNMKDLAEEVGTSEKFLTICMDYEKWNGTKTSIPMALRMKFIDAVSKIM